MHMTIVGCLAATFFIGMSAAYAQQTNTGLEAIGKKNCSVGGSGYINANHRYKGPLTGRTGRWRMSGGKVHINYDNGEYGWATILMINGRIVLGRHFVTC
jgi:hypothetical protein